MTNVLFVRYLDATAVGCGSSTLLTPLQGGGMNSSDVVHPVFFSGTTIDQDTRSNLAYLPPPQQSWIMPSKCVAMDCDGLKHVLLHDLDGSLTGLGPHASITSRAEFMHERRADTSKFTFYNIPTKMLYDPAPLNDLGDPGWDMSAYVDTLEDHGGLFTYRRRARGRSRRRALDAAPDTASEEQAARRRLSATDADWRNRMVFYPGDERDFYLGEDGTACEASSALYDPACRTARRTHREVAYNGYGTYRLGCTLNSEWNAWVCDQGSLVPARLVIESMDEDHTSRSLVPVALASGGYVDLLNGGWDHSGSGCGGYSCLKRLMTLHTTVAANRSYDLAFTSTNPQSLRLMMPSGAGEPTEAEQQRTRVVIGIFYSNPEKLEVYWDRRMVPPLEHWMPAYNSYNFSMRKPAHTDPCGSNAFAAWENKLYVTVCGGVAAGGVVIRTVPKIVLSIGIEVETEEFFDEHYLVRNLASLFGIPSDRMRVPQIVAGSTRRRRRLDGTESTVTLVTGKFEVMAEDQCAHVATCGAHGTCYGGACTCDEGYETPSSCTGGGDCTCSKKVQSVPCAEGCAECESNATCSVCEGASPIYHGGACLSSCPVGHAPIAGTDGHALGCAACHEECGSCLGPAANQCTSCDSVGVHAYLHEGSCLVACPHGHYADAARACHACEPTCASCSGPAATECTSCAWNKCARRGSCPAMVFPLLSARGQCLSNCPEGEYATASGGCAACHPACARCSGGANTDCVDPTPDTPFGDADCAPGARRVGGATTCMLPCDVGHYLLDGQYCAACPSYDCHACNATEPSTCLACRAAPWIRPALVGGTCLEACSQPNEYLTGAGTCETCDPSCASCTGPGAGACTSCAEPTPVLHAGKCLAACPTGFALAEGGGACAPCSDACAACAAPADAAACTACPAGASAPLFVASGGVGACAPFCPAGEFGSTSLGACVPCEARAPQPEP